MSDEPTTDRAAARALVREWLAEDERMPMSDEPPRDYGIDAPEVERDLSVNDTSSRPDRRPPMSDEPTWRSIDTAPRKTRVEILLVNKDTRRYALGWWMQNNDGSGFWTSVGGYIYPTHWMPLPQPPAEESTDV